MIKGKSHSGHNGHLLTLKLQGKQASHAGKMQRVETPDKRAQNASCFRLVPIGRLRAHWKNVEDKVEDAFGSRKVKAMLEIGRKYAHKSCSRELELLHVGI